MSDEHIKIALETIYGALNEIGCILSYQPDIPQQHKEDVWKKIGTVESVLRNLRNGTEPLNSP